MHELTFGRLLGSEMWTFGGELIFRQRITFRSGMGLFDRKREIILGGYFAGRGRGLILRDWIKFCSPPPPLQLRLLVE